MRRGRHTSPSPESGFTIIELVIVLSVAAIILLVVLQALPVLQRSSRNNRRRQDAQTVLQAVSRYELNNSGTIPDSSTLQTFLNNYEQQGLSYYDISRITVATPAASNTVQTYPPAPLGTDDLLVNNHAKCDANGDGKATSQGAGYSDVVALFAIETSGGTSPACQQL